jgi:fumarylpyruvate hydrolase
MSNNPASAPDFSGLPLIVPSVPVEGSDVGYPVRRIFCVGLNYMDHAKEMGRTVERNAPFYFTKSPFSIVLSGGQVPYPTETSNYHHEIEMVVAMGAPAFRVSVDDALSKVYGYACGLDMTRRDLQIASRDKGRPWDLGKDVEQSAIISEIAPASRIGHPSQGGIRLSVNGNSRQHSDIDQMIWSVPEIIADLSRFYHLNAGDLIYTGTPHGVGAVSPGDHLEGEVEGVASINMIVLSAS